METLRSVFIQNINTHVVYFSMNFLKYILNVTFLFYSLLYFPNLRLYIILRHSDIFLAVPSQLGVTNITNNSLTLTTLNLSVVLPFLILPYYLQQVCALLLYPKDIPLILSVCCCPLLDPKPSHRLSFYIFVAPRIHFSNSRL